VTRELNSTGTPLAKPYSLVVACVSYRKGHLFLIVTKTPCGSSEALLRKAYSGKEKLALVAIEV
jgi:hypothetical protein